MKTILSLFVVLSSSFAFANDTLLQCTFSKETGLTAVYLMKGQSPDKILKVEVPVQGKQSSEVIHSEDLEEGYVWLTTPQGVDERILMLTDGGAWDLLDITGSKLTYHRANCVEIND